MRRTNRIEPLNIDPKYLTHAIVLTTTQLEIIRRIEVTPTTRSFTGRIQSSIDRSCTPTSIKPSRKILWCIGCLFFTAGILALSIMITGFIIIFGRMKTMRKSNIERYDLGDLRYGINNINYPSNTYLSNVNKVFIENYLSERLLTESGYRGLIIDEIFIQNESNTNQRKQRDTSRCSIIFIIRNIQIYFDYCSTCINERNLIIGRLFFNRTAFQEPFYLLLNSRHLFIQICSTPNISHLIIPQRLDISDIKKIKTNLKPTSKIVSSISNNINIDISTMDSTETTSIDNFDKSTSFTTDHLSIITSVDSIRTEETSSSSSLDTQTFSYTTESSSSSLNTQTSSYTTESSNSSLDTQTSSYTTESSISSRKTTANIFQFLPFRPSTTIFPWRSIKQPYRVINTNTSPQRRTPIQQQTKIH